MESKSQIPRLKLGISTIMIFLVVLLFTAPATHAQSTTSMDQSREPQPKMQALVMDGGGLAFSGIVTLGAVVFFAVFPAFHGFRSDLARVLQGRGAGWTSEAQSRMRQGLVVAEVAMALILLVGGGLLIRSFQRMMAVDPGFNPENVLYIDPEGVLFAKDVYRQFAEGEYESVMITLNDTIDNVKV